MNTKDTINEFYEFLQQTGFTKDQDILFLFHDKEDGDTIFCSMSNRKQIRELLSQMAVKDRNFANYLLKTVNTIYQENQEFRDHIKFMVSVYDIVEGK